MLLAELAERQRIDGAFEMKVQLGLGQARDEIGGHGIIVCKKRTRAWSGPRRAALIAREVCMLPERVVVARSPAQSVDVAGEAVELEETVVLRGELQVLRQVAIHFQRVAGGVGRGGKQAARRISDCVEVRVAAAVAGEIAARKGPTVAKGVGAVHIPRPDVSVRSGG
jgi:hypothetical protein